MTRKYNKDNPLLRAELKQIRRDELRGEVMKGVTQIRGGQGVVSDSAEELAEAVIARGNARLKAKETSENLP
ncbi:MAG: hypothetical protein WKF90_04470 [Pyrinomonadaceae bacterium]